MKDDFKDKEITMTEFVSNQNKVIDFIKRGINTFQKFGLYMIIFIMLGIYIGISTSKVYYTNKISDVIKVGAFLYQEKVYQITPR